MNAQELLSENVYAHDKDDLIGYGIADTEDPFVFSIPGFPMIRIPAVFHNSIDPMYRYHIG